MLIFPGMYIGTEIEQIRWFRFSWTTQHFDSIQNMIRIPRFFIFESRYPWKKILLAFLLYPNEFEKLCMWLSLQHEIIGDTNGTAHSHIEQVVVQQAASHY